jgi:hypothetical protein
MKTYAKTLVLIHLMILCFNVAWSQSSLNIFLTPSDTLNKPRRNVVLITESVVFIGGIIQINKPFEKDYLNSNFHFNKNNSSDLGMDKGLHVFASYHIVSLSSNMLKWSGANEKEQLICGAGMGLAFLTTVEILDGFSKKGSSFLDFISNGIGTSLYVSQELIWKEQRILPKYSFETTDFFSLSQGEMKNRLTNEFDGQTFWLSVNMHSFIKNPNIPKWLNIAIGYGVEGVDKKSSVGISTLPTADRYRQLYLSFDVDLTKINTNSHFLKTVFYVFNSIKIPAPTMEYSSREGLKGHFLFF